MLRVISLTIVFAGCAANQPVAIDAATPPTVDASSTQPSVAVALTPATVARGDTVTLTVTTADHRLVDPRPGPAPKSGEGHFHYYLDNDTDYTAAWTPTVPIRTSLADTPGVHRVRVVLVTNVHVEVTPLVEATATYTIE